MSFRTIPEDINKGGKFRATASGTLPNGKPVIVNSDGTVSVITETPVPAGFGTPTTGEESYSASHSCVYDTLNNKVVVIYEGGTFGYATAVVGTISGQTVTFGTPVVIASVTSSQPSSTYDSNANKVVVFYQGASSYGYGIVGTVSGTSISFGSPTLYASTEVSGSDAAFDTINNKAVVTYEDRTANRAVKAVVATVSGTSISFGSIATVQTGDSNAVADPGIQFDPDQGAFLIMWGNYKFTVGYARVGVISGTSLSLGSRVTWYSGSVPFNFVMAYDTVAQKMVCTFTGPSNYGNAVIATISGTSVSFGTPVIFASAATDKPSCVYDVSTGDVHVSFIDNGNSGYGTFITGTVSGTSISFGSESVFFSGTISQPDSVYDPDSTNTFITYRDGTSTPPTVDGIVYYNAYNNTTLTSENYIGISTGGNVADTANATVDIIGTLNEEQSGLTPGQAYYVQGDGTLSTTPDDPSVFAGTAISATSLVVKT